MSKRRIETIVIDDDEEDEHVAVNVNNDDDHGEAEFERHLQLALALSRTEAARAANDTIGARASGNELFSDYRWLNCMLIHSAGQLRRVQAPR